MDSLQQDLRPTYLHDGSQQQECKLVDSEGSSTVFADAVSSVQQLVSGASGGKLSCLGPSEGCQLEDMPLSTAGTEPEFFDAANSAWPMSSSRFFWPASMSGAYTIPEEPRLAAQDISAEEGPLAALIESHSSCAEPSELQAPRANS